MRRFPLLLCGLLLVILCGCVGKGFLNTFTSPEDEAVAKNHISLLRDDQFDQIRKDIDPKIKDGFTHDIFEKMRAYIPDGEPLTVKEVGLEEYVSSGSSSCNITYEYQFPDKWLLINVAVRKVHDVSTIFGIGVRPMSDSLEHWYRFTFEGKGAIHYVILALACAVPLFILYALIVCCRTKMKKRKWLWIIFIIVGFGGVTLNWTTGRLSSSDATVRSNDKTVFIPFFSFYLLGAAAVRAAPYGPWMLTVSLPLGAALFLMRRKQLTYDPDQPPPLEPPPKVEQQVAGEEGKPFDY